MSTLYVIGDLVFTVSTLVFMIATILRNNGHERRIAALENAAKNRGEVLR